MVKRRKLGRDSKGRFLTFRGTRKKRKRGRRRRKRGKRRKRRKRRNRGKRHKCVISRGIIASVTRKKK